MGSTWYRSVCAFAANTPNLIVLWQIDFTSHTARQKHGIHALKAVLEQGHHRQILPSDALSAWNLAENVIPAGKSTQPGPAKELFCGGKPTYAKVINDLRVGATRPAAEGLSMTAPRDPPGSLTSNEPLENRSTTDHPTGVDVVLFLRRRLRFTRLGHQEVRPAIVFDRRPQIGRCAGTKSAPGPAVDFHRTVGLHN